MFHESTYPSSKISFRNVLGMEECHHFQSWASLENFLPDLVVMSVESRSKAAIFKFLEFREVVFGVSVSAIEDLQLFEGEYFVKSNDFSTASFEPLTCQVCRSEEFGVVEPKKESIDSVLSFCLDLCAKAELPFGLSLLLRFPTVLVAIVESLAWIDINHW